MKTKLTIATAILTLGVALPFASAEDWFSELRKDRRQYEEARRDGDLKGMENERREIEKDLANLRRERRLDSGYSSWGPYPWGRGYDGDYYRYGRYDGDRGRWHWHPSDRHDRGNHYGWYKHGHRKHRHHDHD